MLHCWFRPRGGTYSSSSSADNERTLEADPRWRQRCDGNPHQYNIHGMYAPRTPRRPAACSGTVRAWTSGLSPRFRRRLGTAGTPRRSWKETSAATEGAIAISSSESCTSHTYLKFLPSCTNRLDSVLEVFLVAFVLGGVGAAAVGAAVLGKRVRADNAELRPVATLTDVVAAGCRFVRVASVGRRRRVYISRPWVHSSDWLFTALEMQY